MRAIQEYSSFTVLFLTIIYASVLSVGSYKIGVLLPYDKLLPGKTELGEIFSARYYAAAVSLAIDRVNNDPTLLPSTTLSFVWNNTECDRAKMIEQQQWQMRQGVVAFVGPSCHARKAVNIAASSNLAVISFGSQDPHLSNKGRFPNFARTSPSNYQSVSKILQVLKWRGWKRVTIVQQGGNSWRNFKRYLTRELQRQKIEVIKKVRLVTMSMFTGPGNDTANQAMDPKSDATIFLSSFQQTQEIMTLLQRMGMLDENPNYGFIAVNFRRMSVNNWIKYPFKWFFSMFHGAAHMNMTKKAFKRLLLVALKPDGEETASFKTFQMELKKRSSMKPFHSDAYQGCIGINGHCVFNRSDSKPPYSGVYLYDAVTQLAVALNELEIKGLPPTGRNIVEKLKRRQFMGIDGHKSEFDKNADLKSKFEVLGLKKNIDNMLPLTENEIKFGV